MRTLGVTLEKFMERVYPEPNTGCWLYAWKLNKDGYGRTIAFGLNNAHRLSYYLHKGEFDRSKSVLHICDVRSCVNPDHLYLGDQQDNVTDREIRKRSAPHYGSFNCNAILDELDVLGIRTQHEQGYSVELLSVKHQVSKATIYDVINRRSWK